VKTQLELKLGKAKMFLTLMLPPGITINTSATGSTANNSI
jgi:hypothetical protein